ncbi:aldo/keto reductase [Desulfopila sp. IMCC35008]|uniref:aldo/keto reductase n=1 Tax=Desulfopila sp. IMCC35008 TaxID=2653858 RepID=UPI0013D75B93|nr:aldo/keto reductase [Desulfopila sp. IMCC35008]
MKIVKLGQQGLEVPAVGLGCMGMSEFYGQAENTNNLKLLDEALEIGCIFWDTADMYGPFSNELLLGKALANHRDKITLATKFGIKRGQDGSWLGISGSPEYVKACCDASLKRLNTDYIDLYYQHRPDPEVPIEETIGTMAELVQAGKIRYIGLSEASADDLEQAHKTHPISALQTEFSLWSRDVEESILPKARELGIGFVSYSPLGRGFLTGTINKREDLEQNDWRLSNPRFSEEAIANNLPLVAKVKKIANEKGVTPSQVALAWVLAQGDNIAVIPGTRHSKYLNLNWAAQAITLNNKEQEELDTFSQNFKVAGERY